MGKWKAAAASMISLESKYAAERVSERRSVHRTLVYRALPLLYRFRPEAEEMFKPYMEIMIDMVCAPDRDGDYEKGMGRHYYCGTNSFGKKLSPVGGYYKNGIGRFSKSARTMMEEDYTMSLTMWKAGFEEQAAVHLVRAIHMLSDICCLPHATKMTYYSLKKCVHQSYEDLARSMYPDAVPEQTVTEDDLNIFNDRECFGDTLNSIVEKEAGEIESVNTIPVESIIARLHTAERAVAALLLRFIDDLKKTPEEAHYITSGAKFALFGGMPPVEAKITAEGIEFINGGETVSCRLGWSFKESRFRAAHRKNSEFTFSPVHDPKGRIVVPGKNRLKAFDPRNKALYIKQS